MSPYDEQLITRYQRYMKLSRGVLVSSEQAVSDLNNLADLYNAIAMAEHKTKSRK